MVSLDIATLVFASGLLYVVQTIAVFVQYRVNKAYSGLGWWLLGTFLQAAGFLSLLAIASPVHRFRILAVVGNPLILAGQVCLYFGLARFLGRKSRPYIVTALYLVFLFSYLYLIVSGGRTIRAFLVFAASTLIFAALAATVFRGRRKPFFASAVFLASVFLLYALFQGFLTVMTLILPPASPGSLFYTNSLRSFAFLIPLLGSTLWSFAFIIMVNQRLNSANVEEKEKWRMIFNLSPDIETIVRMQDGVLVDVNDGFLAMTGYTREEVIGKSGGGVNVWNRLGDLHRFTAELKKNGSVQDREFTFRRKDGTWFFGVVSGRVLQIDESPHIVSLVHDITERKQAEQAVQGLLAEKNLLLKEVHHRIKNNMSTIFSMLSLQASTLKESASVAALEDAKSRVLSMGTLYDALYKSENFTQLSMRAYLPPLVDEIISNFPNAASVTVEKRIDDIVLEITQLQPIGIIINELLTNIMKYAFSGIGDPRILISAVHADGTVEMVVQDNGVGIPPSIDFTNSTGFGMTLIAALAGQLDGTIRIERENGTRIVLRFPL